LIFFVPHSECDFEKVLDCVKIAFHHTNLPEIIHEFEECSKFINFDKFLKDSKISFENTSIKEKEMIGDLFDIILEWRNRRPRSLSQERATEFNMELMIWTKEYAKKILNKLVGLKSS